jgi:hypothetical protein
VEIIDGALAGLQHLARLLDEDLSAFVLLGHRSCELNKVCGIDSGTGDYSAWSKGRGTRGFGNGCVRY